ncbi:transmembrane 6 superfamily member 1-like [Chanos chanos]|uniref:Transmembrane 6 superfamily member 1 n=1 Tax=Chanos chanos TaxID=29144 RepID=A0A6J2UPC7_CHACN|nr:transmembrane 6 superfamily member 1 [Chanos chanos]
MNASAGTGVFVLSLLSIPISYLFNFLLYSNSIEIAVYAAVLIIVVIAIFARLLLKKRAPTDPLFYVFAVCAFLSVVNLIIALEQDGIIDGFMTFYLKEADPYINTAHGHMISYWDGCAHYLMYLLMVAAITWGESYRSIGLYWVGSFLMRTLVYIPGNLVGKYGTQVSSLFLIQLLHAVVLLWSCFCIFSQPRKQEAQPKNMLDVQKKTLLQRPVDLLFVLFLVVASMFCVFRGLIVLDCPAQWCLDYTTSYEPYLRDPSAYPKMQMLVNMLYSVPYFIITVYGLVVPGCAWIPDLTLVHSGAVAQAQFSHIGASLHTRTPFTYRVPAEGQLLFLMVNGLYSLVPQALSYRCVTSPAFFLKAPQDQKSD